MSAPMVRAILAGTKTQTRRIINPPPPEYVRHSEPPQAKRGLPPKHSAPYFDAYNGGPHWCWWDEYDRQGDGWIKCPYGVRGDRLWVRETWKPHSLYAHMKPSEVPQTKVFYRADDGYAPSNTPWAPAIHMPRWASRITLEVTDVRVERLQDISEADAMAEGATSCANGVWFDNSFKYSGSNARGAYRCLWEAINGPGSWDANPWVWVVEFKRVAGLAQEQSHD